MKSGKIIFAAVFCATSILAEDTINEKELIADWYRGDGLGYNVTLTLRADHTYKASWSGDVVGPDGKIMEYGSSTGAWKLENNRLVIAPSNETNDIRGDLTNQEVKTADGKPTLWSIQYPRIAREFHFTTPMVFRRQRDIDADDRQVIVALEENRGPTTRMCTMDVSSVKDKRPEPVPKARFTVPKGWCVDDDPDDKRTERDSWYMVPESQNYKRRSAETLVDVSLDPLQTKDPRNQRAYAASLSDDKQDSYRLLGHVRSINTSHFGRINIYHFISEQSGPQWRSFLIGRSCLVNVRLSVYDNAGPKRYLDAFEQIVKSVALSEK